MTIDMKKLMEDLNTISEGVPENNPVEEAIDVLADAVVDDLFNQLAAEGPVTMARFNGAVQRRTKRILKRLEDNILTLAEVEAEDRLQQVNTGWND